MTYRKTRDILELARNLHTNISKHYESLSNAAEKEKVKLLLDFLSRHEKNLAKGIDEFEEDSSREIMENWFKFAPEISTAECVEDMKISPSMSIDDVIYLAICYDDRLVDFYREAARVSPSEEIRELFNNLLEMEKEEEIVLIRNALEMKEL